MSLHKMKTNIFTATTASILLLACANVDSRIDHKETMISNARIKNTYQKTMNEGLPIAYQRIRQNPKTIANVYIEGDGFAYMNRSTPSDNPTPKTPVGLHLALKDTEDVSVYYISRPCQFITGDSFERKCEKKYWTTHRFSSEILKAFNDTLNQIKSETNINQFNLIGFSGGANIAGLLAVERNDIASIRTVAGNVDNDYFTTYHKVSPMPYSLNMANYSEQLSHVPQIHFIAEDDKFVPRNIADSYLKKLPTTQCAKIYEIKQTTHLKGWEEQWSDLLAYTPACKMN